MPDSLVSSDWELIDPTPDPLALFLQYNRRFFWSKLDSVTVSWSPRMYQCAGVCSYEGRGGLCSIRLSAPLLKLRPRKDLVETLLHEMIHAYLFVTQNNRDRDGHGPEFQKHMHRINAEAKTNITIYHNFYDEVRHYKTHVWKCDGPCQQRKPFYGTVRRTSNRAPGPNDLWWKEHQQTCGGKFHKISEPEEFKKKKQDKKLKEEAKLKKEEAKRKSEITNFFPSSSPNKSNASATQSHTTSNSEGSPSKRQRFNGSPHVLGSKVTSIESDKNKKPMRFIPGIGFIPVAVNSNMEYDTKGYKSPNLITSTSTALKDGKPYNQTTKTTTSPTQKDMRPTNQTVSKSLQSVASNSEINQNSRNRAEEYISNSTVSVTFKVSDSPNGKSEREVEFLKSNSSKISETALSNVHKSKGVADLVHPSKSPSKASKSPANVIKSPPKASKSPSNATKSSAQPIKSPTKTNKFLDNLSDANQLQIGNYFNKQHSKEQGKPSAPPVKTLTLVSPWKTSESINRDIILLDSDFEDDITHLEQPKTTSRKRTMPEDLNLSSHLIDSDEEFESLLAKIEDNHGKKQGKLSTLNTPEKNSFSDSSKTRRVENTTSSSMIPRVDDSRNSSYTQTIENSTNSSNIQRVVNPMNSSQTKRVDSSTSSSKIQRVDNSTSSSKIQRIENSTNSSKIQKIDNSTDSSKIQRIDNSTNSSKIQKNDNSTNSSKIQRIDNSTNSSITQVQPMMCSCPICGQTVLLSLINQHIDNQCR